MNLEQMPQNREKPKKVEASMAEVMPTVNEMIRDPKQVETYIDMIIESMKNSDETTKQLLLEQIGSTGKTRADGLKDLLLMTVPERLKFSNPGDDEKLRQGLDKFLKNQIKKYSN